MKKNIAILRGGDSSESAISLKSAEVVAQHIDTNKYTPYIIHIEGTDWHAVYEQQTYPIGAFSSWEDIEESVPPFAFSNLVRGNLSGQNAFKQRWFCHG